MKRRSFFLIFILIVVIALFLIYQRTGRPVTVKVHKVKRQNLLITVTSTSTGTVKTDREVKITAQRSGQIVKLHFDEGDKVKKGQLLAEIDHSDTDLRIEGLRARLEAQKSRLSELKRTFSASVKEADAEIRRTEAVLKDVERRYRRYKQLHKEGYVSESLLDKTKREYDVALTSYESALSKKERVYAKEDDIKAQKKRIEETETELKLLELEYNRSFIKSPMDGIITSRPVRIGDTLRKGTVVATMVNPEELYVDAKIDEADIARVKVDQEVVITMDAYPNKSFRGRVKSISPVVLGKRLEARTFKVKVEFIEKPSTLKQGMSADIEVITDRLNNVLVVPTQSVIEQDGQRFVFLVSDNKAKLKKVKTGLFNWNYMEIKEGLKEGDLVVTNPDTPGIYDSAKVRIFYAESD